MGWKQEAKEQGSPEMVLWEEEVIESQRSELFLIHFPGGCRLLAHPGLLRVVFLGIALAGSGQWGTAPKSSSRPSMRPFHHPLSLSFSEEQIRSIQREELNSPFITNVQIYLHL